LKQALGVLHTKLLVFVLLLKKSRDKVLLSLSVRGTNDWQGGLFAPVQCFGFFVHSGRGTLGMNRGKVILGVPYRRLFYAFDSVDNLDLVCLAKADASLGDLLCCHDVVVVVVYMMKKGKLVLKGPIRSVL
jgi:hypothetical protein